MVRAITNMTSIISISSIFASTKVSNIHQLSIADTNNKEPSERVDNNLQVCIQELENDNRNKVL